MSRIWEWLCSTYIGSAIIGISVAALLAGLMAGSITLADKYGDRKWDSHYRATYAAWCKLENRHDITFEEWKRLRDAGILRRQR